MSRSRAGFTIGVLTLALAACGGSDTPEGGAPASAPPAASPPPAPAAGGLNLAGVTFPAGVTAAMATAGQTLFTQQPCGACHGPNGTGMEGLGPNLTDTTWLNSDGGFDGIVQTITNGVPTPRASPAPMPPKGGNPAITDAQVRELAAYVFALSHRM
jgi:mono/diheme cytochrome c family protein